MIFNLLNVLNMVFTAYTYMIIIYILMSWVPAAQESKFGQILAKVCEPYLSIFRKIIPPIGMIDISPIVAILALNFAFRGIVILLTSF
ncbi:putative membrane protein YlmG [Lysinibacillus alkalisoli]|uniref:Membrane protein YlmG n=1 Tax=Lysinibacillus alkalisoli TaxID=1911548 RepID=A0A917G3C1_9BACI|nr:YggT family protein [Lysinibacillus alkalisoli]GGG21073.1 putative membrane protein YlmG [Lysinibacillus alkalisoli]